MKIKIYFNYCYEGSIDLAFQEFNVTKTFTYNHKKDELYFFWQHQYVTIKKVSEYINSVIFNGREFQAIEFSGNIKGVITKNINVLEFVLKQIKEGDKDEQME